MSYKVKKQYARGAETFCESFKQLADAKKFMNEKLSEDASMSIKVIYRLYDAVDELIEEVDASNFDPASTSGDQGSQGAGKSAGFRPTPLNTAPRPAGMPHSWIKGEDDDKKDK